MKPMNTAYYDDFQTGGPAYDQPSAQWAQDQLLTAMLGLGFDVAKHDFDKPT